MVNLYPKIFEIFESRIQNSESRIQNPKEKQTTMPVFVIRLFDSEGGDGFSSLQQDQTPFYFFNIPLFYSNIKFFTELVISNMPP